MDRVTLDEPLWGYECRAEEVVPPRRAPARGSAPGGAPGSVPGSVPGSKKSPQRPRSPRGGAGSSAARGRNSPGPQAPPPLPRTPPPGLGPLMGFATVTTFSTWQRSFRFDSASSAAGVTAHGRACRPAGRVDGGPLAAALMGLPRLEDERRERIVWPLVAELSLVGALGCGAAVVGRAVSDLRRSGRHPGDPRAAKMVHPNPGDPVASGGSASPVAGAEGGRWGKYVAIVLQATTLAVPFYERLGFVRVGAVSRYHDRSDMPEVPHRHWTNRVEADDPSYMMCLPLSVALRAALLPAPDDDGHDGHDGSGAGDADASDAGNDDAAVSASSRRSSSSSSGGGGGGGGGGAWSSGLKRALLELRDHITPGHRAIVANGRGGNGCDDEEDDD